VYSAPNEAYAERMGVKLGRRFHAGIEGRISVLMRKHWLDRCLYHGKDGFGRWVGWGIIAGNLAVTGAALAAR
jgi:IS5 family transposase